VEAALEVIGDFGNIRHVDVLVLLIVLGELEVHLLREEVLQEEVHQLGVFFLLEVVVSEHRDTAADHQFSS
jgi:hypothetical protein